MKHHSKSKHMLALLAATLATFAAPALAEQPVQKASPFIPIREEPAPRLHVDPPLAEPLAARGTAVIPYRLENFRILPIFGPAATAVSPRAGHLHVTVDNLPWHWADASNTDTVVVAGLPAGPHSVLIQLATPEHQVIVSQTISFVVPPSKGDHQTAEWSH